MTHFISRLKFFVYKHFNIEVVHLFKIKSHDLVYGGIISLLLLVSIFCCYGLYTNFHAIWISWLQPKFVHALWSTITNFLTMLFLLIQGNYIIWSIYIILLYFNIKWTSCIIECESFQEVQGKDPGTIVVVSKIGYKLRERVIRPALVGVAKAP